MAGWGTGRPPEEAIFEQGPEEVSSHCGCQRLRAARAGRAKAAGVVLSSRCEEVEGCPR